MNEIVNEVKFPSMTFGYDSNDDLKLITIGGDRRYVLDEGVKRDECTKFLPTEIHVVELQCSSCWESFNIETFGDNEFLMPRFCPWCGREVEQ